MDYKNYDHKIWLVGRTGRIGAALVGVLNENPKKFQVIPTDIEDIDIRNLREVESFIETMRPDVIINCSSKRDKVWCEKNPEEAFKTNSIGARNLAIASSYTGAHLIHISSDFVFDGRDEKSYTEFDPINPESVYGKTMAYAEDFVKNHSDKFTIIRSSRLYGKKILNTIIKQAKETGKVNYTVGRSSRPVSTLALAELVIKFLGTDQFGVFHFASQDASDNKTFVEEVLKNASLEAELVERDPSEEAVSIPANLQLDTLMLRSVGYEDTPLWKEDLRRFMTERKVI